MKIIPKRLAERDFLRGLVDVRELPDQKTNNSMGPSGTC